MQRGLERHGARTLANLRLRIAVRALWLCRVSLNHRLARSIHAFVPCGREGVQSDA